MSIKDSREVYGAVARAIHWVIALFVILQLLSVYLYYLMPGNVISQTLRPWHSTLGIAIFAVAMICIFWLFSQRRNRLRQKGNAAKFGHFSIYVLLIAVPVSGILQGYGVLFFGKRLTKGVDSPWEALFKEVHAPLAYILTALVIGHIFMAIYHHVIYRDETLNRMMGRKK